MIRIRKLTPAEAAETFHNYRQSSTDVEHNHTEVVLSSEEWEQEPLPDVTIPVDVPPPAVESEKCLVSKSGTHHRLQIFRETPWCSYCGVKLI